MLIALIDTFRFSSLEKKLATRVAISSRHFKTDLSRNLRHLTVLKQRLKLSLGQNNKTLN